MRSIILEILKNLSQPYRDIPSLDMDFFEIDLNDYLSFYLQVRHLFEQFTDLTVVDYLSYGVSDWNTKNSTSTGFSRAKRKNLFADTETLNKRFKIVVHLLSLKNNFRIRVATYCDSKIIFPSLTQLWPAANWYEREAFDMFGIIFQNHPDLRRLLTDYGFNGYPFRKDFPVIGHDQIIFDHAQGQCIREPVDISSREVVPRIIRKIDQEVAKKGEHNESK